MTEVEFTRQLSELADIATQLNQESNSINALLSRFEGQIRELNVGIATAVSLGGKDELQWQKLSRQVTKPGAHYPTAEQYWGLAINGEPAIKCSRDLRIAALEKLPDLVRDLTWEAKHRLEVIQEAKKIVK